MKQPTLQRKQRGFSLLEIMVSLVIGLVVVGAVLVSYIASGKAGKQQSAYAEMNENAQIALGILSRDLLLAGYANPTSLVTSGSPPVTSFGKTYSVKSKDDVEKFIEDIRQSLMQQLDEDTIIKLS